MKIEFPLLSVVSVCILLFFGFQGDVELHSWEVGFAISSDEVKVTIDPAFAVWVPSSVLHDIGYVAFAFGNVMVLPIQHRTNWHGVYLLAHESNHIEQYCALGWSTYVAQLFINIEPPRDMIVDWSDPDQCDRMMWLPPDWWIDQWHFFSVLVNVCY